jgi:glycosyltransferase involved in cell wall biosynthesis
MANDLRMLFASVDAPPRLGGVSLLADRISSHLTSSCAKEAVFLGPKGMHFDRRSTGFKTYVDFQSETKLREGEGATVEDERIADLFVKIAKNYSLNRIVLWHPFYYGPGAIMAGRALGIPVSVYVHGTELTSQIPLLSESEKPFQPDAKKSDLANRLYRSLNDADNIFTNSYFTKDLVSRVAPDANIVPTGCGVDDDILQRETRLNPEYSRLRRKLKRDRLGLPERTTFIMVGRLVPHKNHISAIEVMKHIPDAQLLVVGSGRELERLKKYSESLGVDDRVMFLGAVSEAEKWNLLAASDAGFLISNYDEGTGGYEGFGIASLEYTAAGCLPISNAKHGMADFAERYEAGLVCLQDDDTCENAAQTIHDAMSDEADLALMIQNAREVVSSRFVWSKVAEIVAETLGDLEK